MCEALCCWSFQFLSCDGQGLLESLIALLSVLNCNYASFGANKFDLLKKKRGNIFFCLAL